MRKGCGSCGGRASVAGPARTPVRRSKLRAGRPGEIWAIDFQVDQTHRWPRVRPLSSDALDALVEWFVAFTTNRQLDDSLILEYRREMLSGS